MSWRRHRRCARILLTLPLAACGTSHLALSASAPGASIFENACNVVQQGPCEHVAYVYGGTKFDACVIGSVAAGFSQATAADTLSLLQWGPAFILVMAVMAADLPLSAVADTVLLPVTIPDQSKLGDRCPATWTPIPWPRAEAEPP